MSAPRLRLAITARAREDIRSIRLYSLQNWGREQAITYRETIDATLDVLRSYPEIGKSRDDLRPGLRSHPVEQHIILYRIERNTLVVQRIVHSRQLITREMVE